MEKQSLRIEELDDGGAIQAINEALQDLLGNVLDNKTEPKKQRKITLEVAVKPNDERNVLDITYQVKQSFAPPKASEAQVLLDKTRDGKPVVTEVRRQKLPFDESQASQPQQQPIEQQPKYDYEEEDPEDL